MQDKLLVVWGSRRSTNGLPPPSPREARSAGLGSWLNPLAVAADFASIDSEIITNQDGDSKHDHAGSYV